MGAVMDRVLKRFRIVEAPTKPQKANRVVRVPDSETVIVELETGYVVAHQKALQNAAYPLRSQTWSWQDGFTKALYRLGLITNDEKREILRRDAEREAEYQREHGRFMLERAVEALNITLTDEQKHAAGIGDNAQSRDVDMKSTA